MIEWYKIFKNTRYHQEIEHNVKQLNQKLLSSSNISKTLCQEVPNKRVRLKLMEKALSSAGFNTDTLTEKQMLRMFEKQYNANNNKLQIVAYVILALSMLITLQRFIPMHKLGVHLQKKLNISIMKTDSTTKDEMNNMQALLFNFGLPTTLVTSYYALVKYIKRKRQHTRNNSKTHKQHQMATVFAKHKLSSKKKTMFKKNYV